MRNFQFARLPALALRVQLCRAFNGVYIEHRVFAKIYTLLHDFANLKRDVGVFANRVRVVKLRFQNRAFAERRERTGKRVNTVEFGLKIPPRQKSLTVFHEFAPL